MANGLFTFSRLRRIYEFATPKVSATRIMDVVFAEQTFNWIVLHFRGIGSGG
jgi:hypothetical protein